MYSRIQNASLQTKITVLLILMSTLLTVTLSTVFYQNTVDKAVQSKEKEMMSLASLIANKIERFLFERSADIKVLSESQLFTMAEITDKTRLNYLENVINAYQAYDSVFIMNNSGHIIMQSGALPAQLEVGPYTDAFLRGEPYVSDILEGEDRSYIFFSEPLFDVEKRVTGAVVEVMNFDAIDEILENVELGSTGYATLKKLDAGTNLEEVTGIHESREGITPYITASAPLQKHATQKNQWVVVIAQEESEAFGVKKDVERYFIYIVAGFLVFFYALSAIISINITQPIRLLMTKTQKLMKDNQRFASDIIVSDEVKTLTQSFDLLLEELTFLMQQVLEKSGEAAHIELIRNSIDELIEGMPNGIITIDYFGSITSVNDYALEVLDLSTEDIVGKSISTHNISRLNPFFDALSVTLANRIKTYESTCMIRDSKGSDFMISYNSLLQYDSHHHLLGLTVNVNHLDTKQHFEESITRAKKLSELGELSAGVAHEIRNPLASIRGYAQMALRELDPEDQVASDIAVILLEVDRLDTIVERFMNFASPNQPKLGLYHMNEIIEETIRLINKDTQTAGILLRHRFTKKDLVRVDYDQIKQVLINLILNAVQSLPKGGQIELVTVYSEISGTMEIHVVDDGEGIAPENMENIFKPFFTTRDKGSGLGLSICSRIIENHNGVIEINSSKAGTQVIIKLPVAESPYER